MTRVTCGRCRTKFWVDLRRLQRSIETLKPHQFHRVHREGVVELDCPHCNAQRKFLMCGLDNEEPQRN